MKPLNVLHYATRFGLGWAIFLILLLASCGGGGGGGTPPQTDTAPPTVSSTNPANSATGVAVNTAITATFSETMDVSSVSTATFTLNNGVTGTVTFSGTTATFTPSSNLSYSTTYTATITTGVIDAAGNAMVADYTWTFTTGTVPDTTPPTVSSTSPAYSAIGVAVNTAITATFSEPMTGSTVTSTTFTLNNGVTGAVTYSGTTATFTPSSNLAYSTAYTATITTGVKDVAGNAMAAPYTWTFTTGTAPDTTPPTVLFTSPTNSQTGVAVNTAITATFSETMDVSTVSIATFTLNNGVTGAVTYGGTTATFTPSNNLAISTTYTATITSGVKDAAGNAVVADYTWTFTTGTAVANLRMPDTGQTTKYTTTFGEDADYNINPPSYADNGNGTITDNVTSLIWQKQDDGVSRTWDNAITYCSNLSLAGQSGWRLPSEIELISLMYDVYDGINYSSINTTYFPGTSSWSYWSSTPYVTSSYAWNVWFPFNYGGASFFASKTDSNFARCVQGGQATPSFTDNGNGTVTDNRTLLMWQQSESGMTWEAALTYCEGLTLAGFTDWRLPNHKELLSLVDYTRFNPALNTTYFPNAFSSMTWSSTTAGFNSTTTTAFTVIFSSGSSQGYTKLGQSFATRCVRGGQ